MKKFAVFDLDGTLIRWQLYHAVVDKLAKNGLLGAEAAGKLKAARMKWKNRQHPDSFPEYELVLIGIYDQALSALSTDIFDKTVQQVIAEYKDQVYTYTRDLINQLKADGYFLLAISGSHQELVQEVAKHYGFDDWSGTKYQRKGKVFSGKKYVASSHKKTELQKLISKHSLSLKDSVGVGDTKSDIGMLEEVQNPIAFNPNTELFQEAKKRNWKIVLERKNVTYELQPEGDHYILL